MSEQYDHLTDEDFEGIERIVEGGLDRQHGEHILAITGADKSRDETTRSLLDAISQARLAQEGNQE